MTTTYAPHVIDLRAYYEQDRHYSLDDLERMLPPLPDGGEGDDRLERTYEGPFNPHWGEFLPDEVQQKLVEYLKGLGLTRHSDGRYCGPCPFPHTNGPSDGQSFYASPKTGNYTCFGSHHEGPRSGLLAPIKSIELPWEQVESAVAEESIAEPYYMDGADGPRRRFPLHTDGGAISKLRNRLNEVWMENRVLEGDQISYDRASHCGELQARKCKRCGVVQYEGHKSRYCCKQRMHPLCMGAQSRKPLWKKRELLDQESDLTVYIIALGSFDIGEEVSQWSDNARDVVKQAYLWIRRMVELKDCPDAVKTSFSGFRADLHQGYLTLDLVLLGPSTFGSPAYLRNYFQQATERDTDVEVVPCRDTDTAINTFGNLMSSIAIYNTPEECQALMDAFKRQKLVQPRGRFMKQESRQESRDSSKEVSPGGLLEISSDESPKGGGEKPPPCHECGGETISIGRIGGNWKKVKGQFSGQVYWFLGEKLGGGP